MRRKCYLAVLSRPSAHVLPWVGPTVGGLLVSGGASSDSDLTMIAGALLAGFAVLPIYIRESAARDERDDDSLHDGQQELASQAAISVLEDGIEVELQERAQRTKFAIVRTGDILRTCVRLFQREDDVRAILYVFDDEGQSLKVYAQQGRPDEAGEFPNNDPRLDSVRTVLSSPEPFRIVEVPVAEQRSYRQYVSLPVRSTDRSFGLLSVDSPTHDLFNERDAEALRLLAVALAFCLATSERGARPKAQADAAPTPELSSPEPRMDVGSEEGGSHDHREDS